MTKKVKTTTKRTEVVAIVVFLVIIFVVVAVSVSLGSTKKGKSDAERAFHVVVNGERYYEDKAIKLNENSITVFRFSDKASGKESHEIRITSRTTAQTVFTYTINGAKRMFMDGEDYTQYFYINEITDGFELTNVKDTPATILERRHAGLNVVAPETDPDVSYFTLSVTSADGKNSLNFALTFNGVIEEKEPPKIIL